MPIRLLLALFLMALSGVSFAQKRDSIALSTRSGKIKGTLTTPRHAKGRYPILIIIPGSGPMDRDGNNEVLRNNMLLYLADSLAGRGIATLRYDKRGLGASKGAAPTESSLRFEDYITDATGWVQLLQEDRRFSRIYLGGHSEGALVGMLAIQKTTAVAGYISIAGAGKPADEVMLDEIRAFSGMPASTVDSTRMYFAMLRKAGHIDVPAKGFYPAVFRRSVQPYLYAWITYDPLAEIARVRKPLLIIQGSTDVQVGVAQAQALAAAKPDAKLVIIEGMNHVLKAAPADFQENLHTYSDPSLPVKPELITAIAAFVTAGK